MPVVNPLLGHIPPSQRTQKQQDAHVAATALMPAFNLPAPQLAKGERVMLTDGWKHADVVADVGYEFNRFHQLTGSCFLPASACAVKMADGSEKPIQDVMAGEEVVTHKGRTRKVIRPTQRQYTGKVYYMHSKSGKEVPCTADHKFLLADHRQDTWVEAQELRSRKHMLVYNGNPEEVGDYLTSLDVQNQTVHCLEVDEDHSFICGGYAVHNCVGAGGGNALFTLIATQRLISDNPTVAFVPWWPFNYGRSRLYMGDRNKGEGSLGSTYFKSLVEDGVFADTESGLPKYTRGDGLLLTRQLELDWSDGDSQLVTQYMNVAKPHPIAAAAELKTVDNVKAAILNGYPCAWACNNFIGDASVQGSGADACVVGYWDTYGPHQQSVHNYWEHPTLGPLYYAMNNWPGNTYPKDPAGGPICGCWVTEKKLEAALRLDAEVFLLSHLAWIPANPRVLEYFV